MKKRHLCPRYWPKTAKERPKREGRLKEVRVKTLLKQGVSLESPKTTEPHWRPLEAAVEELQTGGSIEIVKLLIKAGADVNSWDPEHSLTPLHCAVFSDNTEAAALLLKYGADATCVSNEGDTPLKHAAENRQLEMARLLLRHGADKNINYFGGHCGMSALNLAVKNLDNAMIDLLVEAGADPEALDADGQPARAYLPPRDDSDLAQWQAAVATLYHKRK